MGSSSRVLITIVLCVGIFVLWHFFFGPKKKPPGSVDKISQTKKDGTKVEKQASSSQPASPSSQPAEKKSQAGDKKGAPSKAGALRTTSVEGVHSNFTTKGARGSFTSAGGAMRSWKLSDPRYKELRAKKLIPVDLVQTMAGKGPWPLTTTFKNSDFELPPHAKFIRVKKTATEVIYRWESKKVRVQKHYVVDPVRTVVWMTLSVRNLTERALRQRLQINLYNRQDPNQAKAGFTNPYPKISTILCYANGELHRRNEGAILGTESGCTAAGCGMGEGPVSQIGEVLWIGSDDRYFLTAVVPQNLDKSRRCELKVLKDNVVQASMSFTEGKILPGKAMKRRFAIFLGPKDLSILDSVAGPEKQEAKLSESIEYGWFAVLCRPMLFLLKLFYSWFGNWGVAIILLTLVVKLLTLYWTQKSMRSMKAMQRLKPKIDLLREKFKDDKQRLNQEMMALYKVHKVNPLGGCLPMVIQMPVWFALYRTLGNSVELYRSHFMLWITDLTAPDPYYILPIAMGASMYVQQAITPQPLEGTQAKVMKYFMPGMFTVMMLALPSGLTLYIFVNTVLTMLHQWYMNKTDKELPSVAKEKSDSKSSGSRAGKDNSPPSQHRAKKHQDAPKSKGEGGKPKNRRRRKKKKN